MPILVATVFLCASLLACDDAQPATPETEAVDTAPGATEPDEPTDPGVGPIPEAWVAERVADSRERLTSSEAGPLVWNAIEAHGGLDARRPERRMHTENRVDLWRSRARQREVGEHADATLGWDGERAWITPSAEAFPSPARFWATTPYYFVGIPWVLADPGTRFEQLEDQALEGEAHHIVKVTYEAGTGDSPDDYYVIYIHPETHRVNAIRYVVAYPGFFPEGGHSPEKLMVYGDQREVDGLVFAHELDTYAWDAEAAERGEKVTEIAVSDIELGQSWDPDVFAPPEGAVVSTEIEPRE